MITFKWLTEGSVDVDVCHGTPMTARDLVRHMVGCNVPLADQVEVLTVVNPEVDNGPDYKPVPPYFPLEAAMEIIAQEMEHAS